MSGSAATRCRNSTIDLLRIEQALVHVDVDDLGAVGDLIAGDFQRRGVIAGLDQFAEFGRAGDIGPLADIHEIDVGGEGERLQPGEAQQRLDGGATRGLSPATRFAMARDMVGRGAATAADDIDQAAVGELADQIGHGRRAFVVKPEFIGQAGVGIGADESVGDARSFRHMGAHFARAERAIEADGDGLAWRKECQKAVGSGRTGCGRKDR